MFVSLRILLTIADSGVSGERTFNHLTSINSHQKLSRTFVRNGHENDLRNQIGTDYILNEFTLMKARKSLFIQGKITVRQDH